MYVILYCKNCKCISEKLKYFQFLLFERDRGGFIEATPRAVTRSTDPCIVVINPFKLGISLLNSKTFEPLTHACCDERLDVVKMFDLILQRIIHENNIQEFMQRKEFIFQRLIDCCVENADIRLNIKRFVVNNTHEASARFVTYDDEMKIAVKADQLIKHCQSIMSQLCEVI